MMGVFKEGYFNKKILLGNCKSSALILKVQNVKFKTILSPTKCLWLSAIIVKPIPV
jgi:hypothetical protein